MQKGLTPEKYKALYTPLDRPLEVGDRIELFGGYDYDPVYLRDPSDTGRLATVIKFIPGQDSTNAAVCRLDVKITGDSLQGNTVVLELRHVGQTWLTPSPVHIELCDFEPEALSWAKRRKGEWVEGAANLYLISRGSTNKK